MAQKKLRALVDGSIRQRLTIVVSSHPRGRPHIHQEPLNAITVESREIFHSNACHGHVGSSNGS